MTETTTDPIHREPARWRELYGEDHEWVAKTLDMLDVR